MNIEALFDTPAILANQATAAHLMVRFTAGTVSGGREQPIAFAAVVDRSGSMGGDPLRAAKEAVKTVIRNLRPCDLFALVVFDGRAQTTIPLQKPTNKPSMIALVERIDEGGSTNLTAGWMLARDELLKAGEGIPRRLLLLSDGQMNVGIIEPGRVRKIVTDGLETGKIRTSCLGFGDDYDEILLGELSGATNGGFYDANSPEKLPGIFAAELEGLQAIAIQNLRLRVRRLDFCDGLDLYADYPTVPLPDGRVEIAVGDLVSEEERTLIAELHVLPIPLLPDGKPAASLEGETVLELEVVYDEIDATGISSKAWKQTLRIVPVQDPAQVIVNNEVIPWVAQQRAGRAVEDAIGKVQSGEVDGGIHRLMKTLDSMAGLEDSETVDDARRFVRETLHTLQRDRDLSASEAKASFYSSKSRRRMSNRQHWSGEGPAPSDIKPRQSPSQKSPENTRRKTHNDMISDGESSPE